LSFEPSGGLLHSSLVMQDFETLSYWAIMKGESIAGQFKGTKMIELPVGEKIQWKHWRSKHPDTVVLSVDGKEDGKDSYKEYFNSPSGFRGSETWDKRLKTKEPVFAFRYQEKKYAVTHKKIAGGAVFNLGKLQLFLYRAKDAQMFESTVAFVAEGDGFQTDGEGWRWQEVIFNLGARSFPGGNGPEKLQGGFDTFWYNWIWNNPETLILE